MALHSGKCVGRRLECGRQPIFHTVRVRRDLAPSMVDHGGGTGGRRRRFRLGDSHSSLALGAIGVVPSIVKR
jgi:hypothetical protein